MRGRVTGWQASGARAANAVREPPAHRTGPAQTHRGVDWDACSGLGAHTHTHSCCLVAAAARSASCVVVSPPPLVGVSHGPTFAL